MFIVPYPTMRSVKLSRPVHEADNHTFYFECTVEYSSLGTAEDASARFNVTFYADNITITSPAVLTEDILSTRMYHTSLYNTEGTYLGRLVVHF